MKQVQWNLNQKQNFSSGKMYLKRSSDIIFNRRDKSVKYFTNSHVPLLKKFFVVINGISVSYKWFDLSVECNTL